LHGFLSGSTRGLLEPVRLGQQDLDSMGSASQGPQKFELFFFQVPFRIDQDENKGPGRKAVETPVKALSSEDFPELDLPIRTTAGRLSS
jgi:hypothetical protein